MPIPNVKFCTSTTFVSVNGVRVRLVENQAWHADSDVVRQHPALFTDDPRVLGIPTVEQATAAPGERRSVRRGPAS